MYMIYKTNNLYHYIYISQKVIINHNIRINITITSNQNPKLADELRATGKKTISESGRHKYFANGLAITNKEILNTLKWTGQSQLREILMTVRRELPQAVASP